MTIIILIFAFLFGASIGSFLNVCIYRLPRTGLSVSRPRRSFCPTCGTAIQAKDNVPLVSWLRLGGRCRACRAPISSRYFLVELFTGVVFVFLAQRYLLPLETSSPALFLVLAVLVSALIVASFIDLELRIIPDAITIRGMMVAPVVALLVPALHPDGAKTWIGKGLGALSARLGAAALPRPGNFGLCAIAVVAGALGVALGVLGYSLYQRVVRPGAPRRMADGLLGGALGGMVAGVSVVGLLRPEWLENARVYSFSAALAGMLVGSAFVLFIGIVGSRVFRKPAMGFGDVKLMGLLGAFAGWDGVLAGFFLACFLGSVIGVIVILRSKSRTIPFGPFLASGALAWLFCPETFQRALRWYLGLFH